MTSIQAGFDFYKDIPGYKAIFKAVLKNVIQILVEQLSEQTDEESVLLTASVTDGTLSQLGSESGRYFLEGHDEIKSQFLGFCLKRHHKRKPQETLQVPQPKRFASTAHSIPDLTSLGSENDVYSTNLIPNLSDFSSMMTSHSNQLSGHTSGLTGLISLTGHNAKLSSQTPGLTSHVSRTEKPKIHPISLTKVKRKQQSPLHRSRLALESVPIGSDKETVDKKVDKIGGTGVEMTISDRLQKHGTPTDSDDVNTENVSSSAGQIDSVVAVESHIRIKTETPDYDEISKADPNEVNTGKGVERSEKALDETIEENNAQNKETSIKIEALEEESDLEITGVEGEMNDTTSSFGVAGPDYNDGQLYAQDLSGMEVQGQRTNVEGHQYNGDQAVGVIWLDDASTFYQNPITQIFGCGICDYKSPSKTNVKRHTRRHTCNQNQRPVCEYCHTSFIDKYKLRKHIEANHMGIRYVCKKCGRQFKSPYYLAVHKKCSTNSNTGSDSVDNRSADSAINIVTTPAMIGLGSTDVGELMANSVEADQDQ